MHTKDVIEVPELVGLPAADAHDRALDAGVLAVGRNATHTGAGRGQVSDQEPAAGETCERGAEVGIWIDGARRATDGPDSDGGPDGSGGGGTTPAPTPVGPAGGGVAG